MKVYYYYYYYCMVVDSNVWHNDIVDTVLKLMLVDGFVVLRDQ